VTGECPSMLMFGRKVRTRLDLLRELGGRKENQLKHFKGKREEEFEEGEMCFARDYKNPNKRSWKKGVVEEVLGKRIYLVRILDSNVVRKRHLDQMIKSGDFYRNPSENLDYENEQNSDVSKQLDDELEKEILKENLDLVLGQVSVESLKSVEIGRCERRPGLRGKI